MRAAALLMVVAVLLVPGAAASAASADRTQARAGTGQVRGVVVDAVTRLPLPHVHVEVEQGAAETTTDELGAFTLGLPAGHWWIRASVVDYGLGRIDVDVPENGVVVIEIPLQPGTAPYVETVTVRPGSAVLPVAAGSSFTLDSGHLLALRGVLADDPFRAVQAAPAAATGDDFRAEFSVRGHGWRNLGVTLDGVDTRLLMHSVRGVADTGSLAIFNTDVLSSATLEAGVHTERDVGRLGGRLRFDIRDGSREHFSARGAVSGTAASAVAEGPIDDAGRASWLVSVRQSYLDWLLRRIDPDADETFGFLDGIGRVSWQVSPRQLLRVTAIGARSKLQGSDMEDAGPDRLEAGRSTTRIGNVEWRVAAGPSVVVTQRVWGAAADYRNDTVTGATREQGDDRELTYRSDVEWQISEGASVEGGFRLGAVRASRIVRSFGGGREAEILNVNSSDQSRGGWASVTLSPMAAVRVTGGARAEWTRASGETTVSPWLLWEVGAGSRTTVRGGVGHLHQHAEPRDIGAPDGSLAPESALLVDLGVEHALAGWTFEADGYYRNESDVLRPGGDLLVRGSVIRRRVPGLRNRLTGRAAGAEFTIRRTGTGPVGGWIGYSVARYDVEDEVTGERFPADFDQTHGVTGFVDWRLSGRTRVSVRARAGSNVPVAAYAERVGETYYLGTDRNAVRLPPYLRVDLRADRVYQLRRHRLTLFVEVLNVLNRRNLGPGDPSVNVITGRINDAVEKLFPILPSVGFLLEW